ncbi:MAG: S1 RNA-binding domain-containing protein [bacterium]|nr:S1 RNA-binding domain-containing protein [bacterium]
MELSTQTVADGDNGLTMKDLLSQANFDLPKIGDTLDGEVISVSKNGVLVDLGSLGTGIVYPGEFYDKPSMQKDLKPGEKISSILMDIETEDGFRELSLRRAQKTTAWQSIKKLKDDEEVITTSIININKGGAIVEVHGVQGFLPLSQLNPEHYPKVEGGDTTKIVQSLQKLKNKEVKIKIIDFNEGENKLIVSEKAVGDDQLKKELEKFKVGDTVDGTVTGVTDFGAFISIDSDEVAVPEVEKVSEEKEETPSEALPVTKKRGVEGLIHISEIDWKLVDDPRDYLKKGQEIKAKIISIEGTKISLSLKALKPDPWQSLENKYQVGQTLDATITKVNNYGALAALDEEIIGLIPLSEFAGKKPQDVVQPGDKVSIAIVSIEPQDHKMLLTLSSLPEQPKAEPERKEEIPENK